MRVQVAEERAEEKCRISEMKEPAKWKRNTSDTGDPIGYPR